MGRFSGTWTLRRRGVPTRSRYLGTDYRVVEELWTSIFWFSHSYATRFATDIPLLPGHLLGANIPHMLGRTGPECSRIS
jgi:hypothetical protein